MNKKKRKKVFVVNRSGHDFSKADKFGDITFLSEGKIDPNQVTKMYREFVEAMKDSSPEDYLVITGLSIMSSVASACLAYKHGRINFLIFRDGNYEERTLLLGELMEREQHDMS